MAFLKSYNAAGTGLRMTAGPSLLDANAPEPEITREVDLGGGRYLISAKIEGIPQFDNATFVIDISGRPRVESFSAFEGSARVLDLGNINATEAELFAGLPAVLDGNDRIVGAGYSDLLQGFTGDDVILGNGGNDRIVGGTGNDRLFGNAGNDRLAGASGRDALNGGGGNDLLSGGGGSDRLAGARGDDRLSGGGGADRLSGGAGDDRLLGGGQADRLNGGAGDDLMSGGRGADTFIFNRRSGEDEITDFGAGDTIRIQNGARDVSDVQIRDTRAGLELSFADTEILLRNLDRGDLDAGDIVFV